MIKTLSIQVRDQYHDVVRIVREPSDEPFFGFCRLAEDLNVRYIDFVVPYVDSMLNLVQLTAWLEDFPAALQSDVFDERQRSSALTVFEAAQEAVELAGYLYFDA